MLPQDNRSVPVAVINMMDELAAAVKLHVPGDFGLPACIPVSLSSSLKARRSGILFATTMLAALRHPRLECSPCLEGEVNAWSSWRAMSSALPGLLRLLPHEGIPMPTSLNGPASLPAYGMREEIYQWSHSWRKVFSPLPGFSPGWTQGLLSGMNPQRSMSGCTHFLSLETFF